jgi:hypothetical protein
LVRHGSVRMYERMSCSANGIADAVGTKGAREALVWGGVVVAADIVGLHW